MVHLQAVPVWLRWLGVSLLVAASYALVSISTLAIGMFSGEASPLWPAAGIAFAVTYAWGWRLLPGVVVGALIGNLVTVPASEGDDAWVRVALSVAIAAGVGLQASVGASLVTRADGPRASLTHAREIIAFLLLAGPLAALVGATVATVSQVALGFVGVQEWAALFVTWWAGDAIGVVVFGPLVLMLLPGQSEVWRGRRVEVAVPMLLGTLIFGAFFIQAETQADRMREQRLQQAADEAAGVVERAVARDREVLEGVARFIESSDWVDADEFRFFVRESLARYPSLQAVSWNPILAAGEVSSFEAAQREQGLTGYRVTERDGTGALVPVAPREEYVPVGYIEPLAANAAALGFDINSDPVRRSAIEQVRERGEATATPPIDLVQETDGQKGMLAFVPVFARSGDTGDVLDVTEEVAGLAVGVYRFGSLLEDAFSGPEWAGTDVALIDVTEADAPRDLAQRTAPRSPAGALDDASDAMTTSRPVEAYGRIWQVEVTPVNGVLADADAFRIPGLEVMGLLVLGLLQAFVLVVTGMERRARHRAEDSAREASTDPLTGLGNRRAFLRTLERVRTRDGSTEAETSVLLFLDLDRFKSVNDIGGHEAGDAMLRSVAETLTSHVRSRDLVARIGGDEFAIILNNCSSDLGLRIAHALAEGVCALRVSTPAGPLGVGISIGVVSVEPDDHRGIDELIRMADDACYAAKHRGGGVEVVRAHSRS